MGHGGKPPLFAAAWTDRNILSSAVMPVMALVFGELVDAMNTNDPDKILEEITRVSIYFLYIGLGGLVTAYCKLNRFQSLSLSFSQLFSSSFVVNQFNTPPGQLLLNVKQSVFEKSISKPFSNK